MFIKYDYKTIFNKKESIMRLFLDGKLISPFTISENNFDELIDESIISIEIPLSINNIKNYAFYDCNNLIDN
jgi:hypothetical protein